MTRLKTAARETSPLSASHVVLDWGSTYLSTNGTATLSLVVDWFWIFSHNLNMYSVHDKYVIILG